MILGKSAIRQALASGEIKLLDDKGEWLPEWAEMVRFGRQKQEFGLVGDKDPIALQPASIDLHLGNEWLVPKPNGQAALEQVRPDTWAQVPATDSRLPIEYETTVSDSFWIPAHGFVLVRTREVVGISDRLTAFVEGRSSVGRLGLFTENAGWVDPGFVGSVTLELFNALPNPLLVHSGTRACQLVFARVDGSTEGGYRGGKYQEQVKTTGSLLHRDFEA